MSILTQSLEKILNWLRVNDPESVSGLRPGLSNSEIEQLTNPLSLHLPWEVREIYHYCNGKIALAESLVLYPLEVAVQNTCYADWMKGNVIPSSRNILPLFQGDGKDFYYVVCDVAERNSPVWCVFVGGYPLICAASLTSLILTFWECYETGAYYIELDEEGYPYVERDFNKFQNIFQKYNPEQMDSCEVLWGY